MIASIGQDNHNKIILRLYCGESPSIMHGETLASNIRELIEIKNINKVYLYHTTLPVECEVSDLSFSSHHLQVKSSIYDLKAIQHYQILEDTLSLYFNPY